MCDKVELILIGGGGHCKSCIEVIESTNRYEILGILDVQSKIGKRVLGYEIVGQDSDIAKFTKSGIDNYLVTLGQIKSGQLRKRLFENIYKNKGISPVIISKTASVSKRANIGAGTIIMHDAIVNADVSIGKNCIINTKANIEHDVIIGNHVHISTSATINGQVNIGDEVFIGSNAVIRNVINICDRVVIGAGSVVVKDITEPGLYIGNPLIRIK